MSLIAIRSQLEKVKRHAEKREEKKEKKKDEKKRLKERRKKDKKNEKRKEKGRKLGVEEKERTGLVSGSIGYPKETAGR